MSDRTHGSPELDKDAAKLEAMGEDAGLTLDDLGLPVWQGRCGICGKLPCDFHGHPVPVGEV
jgi:hypothetical protein